MTEERKGRPFADADIEEIQVRVEASADCMYPKSQMTEAELLQAIVDRVDLLDEVKRLRARGEDLAVRLFALSGDMVDFLSYLTAAELSREMAEEAGPVVLRSSSQCTLSSANDDRALSHLHFDEELQQTGGPK